MATVNIPCDATDLGIKGIAFLVICVFILVCAIMSFFAKVFGIIIAVLALLLALLGAYCVWTKNTKGLLMFIIGAFLVAVLALINIFVLMLAFRELNVVPYIGTGGLIIFPGINAYLAYDGRGKTLSWDTP